MQLLEELLFTSRWCKRKLQKNLPFVLKRSSNIWICLIYRIQLKMTKQYCNIIMSIKNKSFWTIQKRLYICTCITFDKCEINIKKLLWETLYVLYDWCWICVRWFCSRIQVYFLIWVSKLNYYKLYVNLLGIKLLLWRYLN